MMRRVLIWAGVVLVLASAAHGGGSTHAPVVQSAGCAEDMPCWNCATMGNKQCGGALGTLQRRIARLDHACVPVYTGGGVTQCAQPDTEVQRVERALRACMLNAAYVASTQADTWAMHAQCLDDWDVTHPRR